MQISNVFATQMWHNSPGNSLQNLFETIDNSHGGGSTNGRTCKFRHPLLLSIDESVPLRFFSQKNKNINKLCLVLLELTCQHFFETHTRNWREFLTCHGQNVEVNCKDNAVEAMFYLTKKGANLQMKFNTTADTRQTRQFS